MGFWHRSQSPTRKGPAPGNQWAPGTARPVSNELLRRGTPPRRPHRSAALRSVLPLCRQKESLVRRFVIPGLALIMTATLWGPAPAQSTFREERARVLLVEAINTGTPLFNAGDWAGCSRVYHG